MLASQFTQVGSRLSVVLLLALLTAQSSGSTAILISVPEQKLVLVRDGERVAQYRISTSRFGLGDKPRSFATPLGRLEVADRLGAGLPPGSVFKQRHPTGEVLAPNARGRDPIVTRILHLRGLQEQNENAFARAIYIHGTPVERTLGKPDSYGCIRMRSRDVIELFDRVPTGTAVEIVDKPVSRTLPGMLAATTPRLPSIAEASAEISKVVARTSTRTEDLPVRQLGTDSLGRVSWSANALFSAQANRVRGAGTGTQIPLLSVTELPSLGGAENLHVTR